MGERFFGTDGIRGRANEEPLTPETALKLGQAAALTLIKRGQGADWPRCVIGKDTRISCDMLESAFAAGLVSAGVDVLLAGVIPTPAVALLTKKLGLSMGVMVSASHNPFADNGLKFFGADGYKLNDAQEAEIEDRVRNNRLLDGETRVTEGKIGRISPLPDAKDHYVHAVLDTVRTDCNFLEGKTVALDCANGAAFETSPVILEHLGARVVTAFDQPNGVNINVDCGATHPEAIQKLVKDNRADVGISHDGDADRLVLCDENAEALDGDELLAIAAADMCRRGTLKEKVLVATVMSNFGLGDLMEASGGKLVRSKVGDRHVIEAMRKGGYNLGGEQSGHIIFGDFSTTGDGILAAVQILQIMAAQDKPLSELRRCLRKYPQAQRNIRIRSKPPVENLESRELVRETESRLGESGRILLRYSGTEPLIRLLIEGPEKESIETAADRIAASLKEEIGA